MTDQEIERRILSAQIAVKEEEIRILTDMLEQMKTEYNALKIDPQRISSLLERYNINIH